jgi:GNAT superfamily N-acetyltransferase
MVGAATAAPLTDHADEFAAPFANAGLDPGDYFYLAESVLLPEYRGRGAGRRFFEMREMRAGRRGFRARGFAAVIRPSESSGAASRLRALWMLLAATRIQAGRRVDCGILLARYRRGSRERQAA